MIEGLKPHAEYKDSGDAASTAPKGRCHPSPGQRPGFGTTHMIQALKGRPKHLTKGATP